MLSCEELFELFRREGMDYFCGVPDSTFKGWMNFLDDAAGKGRLTNRIAAIERDAVGLAAGYHVATGRIGTVYMQNSGLGNAVNPITSLTDAKAYGIPLLLMIGWRGEPGRNKDEPQHLRMGEVTIPILEALEIKYALLPGAQPDAEKVISGAKEYIAGYNEIFAIVIRDGILADYEKVKRPDNTAYDLYEMKREEAIRHIASALDENTFIVATTGKTSRELFEYRESTGQDHDRDFLMIGAMGLASSFGAELALQRPEKRVVVLDGDGAFLMSEGALSTIGYYSPENYYHVLFDNGVHDSTGGQPTTSKTVNFAKVALAHGYKGAGTVCGKTEFVEVLKGINGVKGPFLLVVKVREGARKDLGRPTTPPIENKQSFMRRLSGYTCL